MTPIGPISLAQSHLRQMLADCPAFRTWASAADVTAALARIHQESLPPPAEHASEHTLAELHNYRPYALIWTAAENGLRLRADAASAEYEESGRLMIQLIQDVPADLAGQPAALDMAFKNSVGQIMADLCAHSGQAGYLCIRELGLAYGPYRTHPDDLPSLGDAIAVELIVDWG